MGSFSSYAGFFDEEACIAYLHSPEIMRLVNQRVRKDSIASNLSGKERQEWILRERKSLWMQEMSSEAETLATVFLELRGHYDESYARFLDTSGANPSPTKIREAERYASEKSLKALLQASYLPNSSIKATLRSLLGSTTRFNRQTLEAVSVALVLNWFLSEYREKFFRMLRKIVPYTTPIQNTKQREILLAIRQAESWVVERFTSVSQRLPLDFFSLIVTDFSRVTTSDLIKLRGQLIKQKKLKAHFYKGLLLHIDFLIQFRLGVNQAFLAFLKRTGVFPET